ncbi:MAG: TMEM175 family protein [Candidatus Kapabacteria bacterium]|jgi:uncharacterized membrane protein|nr:TMEM175 family protein [Candidatus Kapabacteria bacterium]
MTISITKDRLEAFSDGVFSIIITLMVFDIKLPTLETDNTFWQVFLKVLPQLEAYILSFVTIAIIWINHHNILALIKHVDMPLLWYNFHLLFWCTLIPFVNNFIGRYPHLSSASASYGLVSMGVGLSFMLLRRYAGIKAQLMHDHASEELERKVLRGNITSVLLYALATALGFISPYISYAIFAGIAIYYVLPDRVRTRHR